MSHDRYEYTRCPTCGKALHQRDEELLDCDKEVALFKECDDRHKFTEYFRYGDRLEYDDYHEIVKGWDKHDTSLKFGRFYLGCYIDGVFHGYSWDGYSSRFYEVDDERNRYVTYTRMSVEVAMETINEFKSVHPDINIFLIPYDDAVRWGLRRD